LVVAFVLISLNKLTSARSTAADHDVELREIILSLRDALHAQKKRAEAMNSEETSEHIMKARGAWDDFKSSLKKAGQKVKNAFGKKEEEEERQLEGLMPPGAEVSKADLLRMKQEITNWKEMVRAFGIENDPEIKKMEAQLDMAWEVLELDNV